MDMKQELKMEEMEEATGGVTRTVNTGIAGMNAAVRSGAGTGSRQIASLPSGTTVNTLTDELVYDPVSKRNFVQIGFFDKNGSYATGWIAASIVGLPR